MKYLLFITLIVAAFACGIARAGQTINGFHYEDPVHTETLPMPSVTFSAEDGENMARSARVSKGRKAREQNELNTNECFGEMREAAEAGNCSITFFSENAKCDTVLSGSECYENRHFRRKLSTLGFKVIHKEMPTQDEEDDCSAIIVKWCVDLRGRR